MTIKDYMRKVESEKMTPKDSAGASFTDAMMETTEIWSNDACVGYFLRAAQIVGLDQARQRHIDAIPKIAPQASHAPSKSQSSFRGST